MIASPCSITFTPAGGSPVTLVAIGALMVSLPRFEASAQIYELGGVESAEGYFQPLGGVGVSITFEAVEEADYPHPLFLDAETLGGSQISGVTGSLGISDGEWTATFSPAVLRIRPGLPIDDPPALSRVFTVTTTLPEIE